ncbi:MAG TPA: hypothetical protein PKO15_11745 [Fibrobacteria bacterium]|nr:hypothetical protein [Fibrobacteria bacterium]HOX50025.1 hypothetical protein [Fibrobacteria bacterium]
MGNETVRLARKRFSQHEVVIHLIYDVGMRRSLAKPWKLFLEQVSLGNDPACSPVFSHTSKIKTSTPPNPNHLYRFD